jgi:nickel-dependent lactate racemase
LLLEFEYGHGRIPANLPDSTDVFIPGETVSDPAHIPEAELINKTKESLHNPVGMPPLSQLAFKGAKCVIVFPDRVKGGEQPTSHRKTAIPLVLEELYSGGAEKKDILLICSNGLHSKNTEAEIRAVLGEELFNQFWHTGQIINHDSEDWNHLVDLGTTSRGDPVIMNKYVYDADVAVLIGHTQGNPYGGYSGGYKHCSTGLTHWRSIASHHTPSVMHKPDFVPVSGASLMRTKFDEIGMHMEAKMGKKFFCCDAVLDTKARQIEIFSGYAAELEPLSWAAADKRTYVHWAKKKYDVLVFGMPQSFHYGDGMGTNPIMLMQALSAQVIRHKRIMKDNCIIICSSICNGYFHDELWPYTRELFSMFGNDYMNTLPDLNRYGEYFATNENYIRRYRYANAFHPFHGFSMMTCGHLVEKHTAAVYIAGASQPGIARMMGLKTRASIEEALSDASGKYCGGKPEILALPRTFTTSAVHLCLNGERYTGTESTAFKLTHGNTGFVKPERENTP